MRVRFALILAWTCLAPPTLLAQERSTIEVLAMSSGPGGLPGHTVADIAADGSIQLRPMDVPAQLRGLIAKSEGYYLLLSATGRPASVYRVLVQEVGTDGVLKLASSAEAARSLKPGDLVLMLRPPTASTAQLKALPEVIPITGALPDDIDQAQLARRARSVNNLKQIGLAMHNFHSAIGCFPPAVILGPDGKPWHSWRVLILAYLEQADLFNRYDFNQPWDSRHNLTLLDEMPDVYRDPIHGGEKGHDTHYVAITGKNDSTRPRAPFQSDGPKQTDAEHPPFDKGITIQGFTDGTSNTILVVPADPAHKVPWTKPEDIEIDTGQPGKIAEFGKPGGIPTFFTMNALKGGIGVAPVLFADGSVRLIATTINPLVTRALQTRDGGEVIAADAIPGDNLRPAPTVRVLHLETVAGKTTATFVDYKP